MKLIDKDAVVAIIERQIRQWNYGHSGEGHHRTQMLYELMALINTNEVKEVDLGKEYKEYVEEDPVYNKLVNGVVGKAIAKHFFELGLKAQKGE